jgi:hypothetical protein
MFLKLKSGDIDEQCERSSVKAVLLKNLPEHWFLTGYLLYKRQKIAAPNEKKRIRLLRFSSMNMVT